MSAEDSTDTDEDTGDDEQRKTTEAPEVTEDHKEVAKEMRKAYEEKETAELPGTDKTITGTAVNDWLDDDGNPKFGKDEESGSEDAQDAPKDAEDTAKA